MTNTNPTLSELAGRGEIAALEDRWLAAIEGADEQRDDLLAALEILTKKGHGDEAAVLGSMWLTSEQETLEPCETLDLTRELMLRCKDNDEMREALLGLYPQVYADRPGITQLIDISGLAGSKSPRRALRTLDICLGLEVGAHLIARSDEHVVRVTAIDVEACEYTITSSRGDETLDADGLALAYDPVDDDDFRVLTQLCAEKIPDLLQNDPVTFVIGLLKGQGGRIDSDQLEHLLAPRFVAAKSFSAWWSKTRAALKRSANVVLEGRNPVVLTYHAEGRTLEDEIAPQWKKARTTVRRLAVIESYLREAKSRKCKPAPTMVQHMRQKLHDHMQASRAGAPGEALMDALMIDQLDEAAGASEEQAPPAHALLSESPDMPALLQSVEEPSLHIRAIGHIKMLYPDDWPNLYASILPVAPFDSCEVIARKLAEEGHGELLEKAVQRIVTDFTRHLDAVYWLWYGQSGATLRPIPSRELLLRMLEHLGELVRGDEVPASVLRNARTKIRSALSARKYARFRKVIANMEAGLASTVCRTIERLDGLGQTVPANLIRIIHDTHPELIVVKKQVDPWHDESVMFATQHGIENRQKELNHLINVKMGENAKAIGAAAAHGDLSENSEYKFALEERDLLRARAAQMQDELSIARVLTANDVSTDHVDVGTRVTLIAVEDNLPRDVTILGPFEADIDKGIYNYRAPLCAELRGLRVGDTVTLHLDDPEQTYRVDAITNALGGLNASKNGFLLT